MVALQVVVCLIIKRQATAYFLQRMENDVQEDKFVDISTKRFIFSYFIFNASSG